MLRVVLTRDRIFYTISEPPYTGQTMAKNIAFCSLDEPALQKCYTVACDIDISRDLSAEDLHPAWQCLRNKLQRRLNEFAALRRTGREANIFAELAFCLMTPQSKALNCWAAVKRLFEKGLLFSAPAGRLSRELSGVRFHHTKARRIILARRRFFQNGKWLLRQSINERKGTLAARDWLTDNVLGLGYKEASHFLRNIGYFDEICILDRHILRNLKTFGVIDEVPDTLPRARYLEIEGKMKDFAKQIKIPVAHLDLLLWCKETGEIFK